MELLSALRGEDGGRMNDLIDREQALKAVSWDSEAYYAINNLPSAERNGRWLDVENDIDYYPFMCSECHETVIKRTNYCPQCGARMVN